MSLQSVLKTLKLRIEVRLLFDVEQSETIMEGFYSLYRMISWVCHTSGIFLFPISEDTYSRGTSSYTLMMLSCL